MDNISPGESITITATEINYVTSQRIYEVTEDDEQYLTISMSPLFLDGEIMRVTLNWGVHPEDLDLHGVERNRNSPQIACEVWWR